MSVRYLQEFIVLYCLLSGPRLCHQSPPVLKPPVSEEVLVCLSILCCLLLCSGILLSVLFKCPFACLFCLGVFWDCLYSLRFHFLFCLSCLSILQEFTSCFCLIFWILLSIFYILFKQLLGISFQVFMSSLWDFASCLVFVASFCFQDFISCFVSFVLPFFFFFFWWVILLKYGSSFPRDKAAELPYSGTWTGFMYKNYRPESCKHLSCQTMITGWFIINWQQNESWIFIGNTDAEAETPIHWLPGAKNWLIWKDPDARKDWTWEEKGTTEDEIVGWHHQLDGREFE